MLTADHNGTAACAPLLLSADDIFEAIMAGKRKSPRRPTYEIRDCGYETPCYVWLGARNPKGYGGTTADGRRRSVHIVAFERLIGPIPADRPQLDHKCRTRACFRPDHLEPVTNAENQRRGLKSKLTWEIVDEIRASPLSTRQMAARLGVSPPLIHYIRSGRSWNPDAYTSRNRGRAAQTAGRTTAGVHCDERKNG